MALRYPHKKKKKGDTSSADAVEHAIDLAEDGRQRALPAAEAQLFDQVLRQRDVCRLVRRSSRCARLASPPARFARVGHGREKKMEDLLSRRSLEWCGWWPGCRGQGVVGWINRRKEHTLGS